MDPISREIEEPVNPARVRCQREDPAPLRSRASPVSREVIGFGHTLHEALILRGRGESGSAAQKKCPGSVDTAEALSRRSRHRLGFGQSERDSLSVDSSAAARGEQRVEDVPQWILSMTTVHAASRRSAGHSRRCRRGARSDRLLCESGKRTSEVRQAESVRRKCRTSSSRAAEAGRRRVSTVPDPRGQCGSECTERWGIRR